MLEVEKDVNEKEVKQKANERVIFSKSVREQKGDIYKVNSNGVTVEFTNKFSEALSAFKETVRPKQMYKLPVGGGCICLYNENA